MQQQLGGVGGGATPRHPFLRRQGAASVQVPGSRAVLGEVDREVDGERWMLEICQSIVFPGESAQLQR